MITGTVNSFREAVVRLVIRGSEGQEREIDAVVDTGFNGWVTLPPDIIAALALPLLGKSPAVLADGSEVLLNLFEAAVVWEGRSRRVTIHAADAAPLLGMDLLYGHELAVQVVEGGKVSIRELPLS